MKVDVLCCGEWCRKWLEGRLKFDMLWGFRRIFVNAGRFEDFVGLSCEENCFVGFGLLEIRFFSVGQGICTVVIALWYADWFRNLF